MFNFCKHNLNLKVEIVLGKRTEYTKNRKVYYRILPSELSFIERLFCNCLKEVYHSSPIFFGKQYLFNKTEYYSLVERVNTLGDMYDYFTEEDEKIKKTEKKNADYKRYLMAKHEIWPDEDV